MQTLMYNLFYESFPVIRGYSITVNLNVVVDFFFVLFVSLLRLIKSNHRYSYKIKIYPLICYRFNVDEEKSQKNGVPELEIFLSHFVCID